MIKEFFAKLIRKMSKKTHAVQYCTTCDEAFFPGDDLCCRLGDVETIYVTEEEKGRLEKRAILLKEMKEEKIKARAKRIEEFLKEETQVSLREIFRTALAQANAVLPHVATEHSCCVLDTWALGHRVQVMAYAQQSYACWDCCGNGCSNCGSGWYDIPAFVAVLLDGQSFTSWGKATSEEEFLSAFGEAVAK